MSLWSPREGSAGGDVLGIRCVDGELPGAGPEKGDLTEKGRLLEGGPLKAGAVGERWSRAQDPGVKASSLWMQERCRDLR